MIKEHPNLGPRGCAVINSANRNHARQWLSENSVRSAVYNSQSISDLNAVYNDTTDELLYDLMSLPAHSTLPATSISTHKPSLPPPPPAPDGGKAQQLADLLTDLAGKPEIDLGPIEDAIQGVRDGQDKLGERVAAVEAQGDSIRELAEALKGDKGAKARRAKVIASTATNPVLKRIAARYAAGTFNGGNVVSLAGPAGFGKSHAVRELGRSYDVCIEHGCSADIDEVSTLLGSVTPDGVGGFIITDGVLTEAFREAAGGKSVLLFLDEHLRWTARTREFLLTTLQPITNGAGEEVFRLRTRKPVDGVLEVLEAKVENIHIIAACNLEANVPEGPYWDRFDHVRIDYNRDELAVVLQSILDGFEVAKCSTVQLAETVSDIIGESRQAAVDGRLLFSVSPRDLKRACLFGGETEAEIAVALADALADKTQNWDADTGDRQNDSDACEGWADRLKSLAAAVTTA